MRDPRAPHQALKDHEWLALAHLVRSLPLLHTCVTLHLEKRWITTALIIISHRKRDLRSPGLAQPVIGGGSHHPPVAPADQRQAINATGLRVRARDSVGASKAVEAEVAALRRKAVVERLDVVEVPRSRPPAGAVPALA